MPANYIDDLSPLSAADLEASLRILGELEREVSGEASSLGVTRGSGATRGLDDGPGDPKGGGLLGPSDRDVRDLNAYELSVSPGRPSPGSALADLRATRIGFGDPRNELIRLTPKLFDDLGLELAEIQRRQMRDRFDFYFLSLTLSLQPKRGAQFRLVECRLSFASEDNSAPGGGAPIVHTLFPTAEWRDVLAFGTQMTLALDADLQWKVGLPEIRTDLPVQLQAKVGDQAKLGAFVVAPKYSYQIGRSEIIASGLGTDTCFWRLQSPELRRTHDVAFKVIIKVPKGSGGFRLAALATAEPSMNWLAADLRHVWDHLSERFKRLLDLQDSERQGAERLPIGVRESWNLVL